MKFLQTNLTRYLVSLLLLLSWNMSVYAQQTEPRLIDRLQQAYADEDIIIPEQVEQLLSEFAVLERTFQQNQSRNSLQSMEIKEAVTLEGGLAVRSFSSRAGSTINYQKTLMITSEEEIFIGGDISGGFAKTFEEGNIVLKSNQKIVLEGNLIAAMGADGDLQDGGRHLLAYDPTDEQVEYLQGKDGGNILLIAPEIIIRGTIIPGDGGAGIAGSDGGDGGSLITFGNLKHDQEEVLTFYGGHGGHGGDGGPNEKAGDGGDGGGVFLINNPNPIGPINGGSTADGDDDTGEDECTNEADAVAGDGGDGGFGIICSQNGGNGGKGGDAFGGNPPNGVVLFRYVCNCRGGNATGGKGGDGKNGASGCGRRGMNKKGGDGGDGGKGGNATGGQGQFPSGDGGWAWAGKGGNGGDGGKGADGNPAIIQECPELTVKMATDGGDGGKGGKGGDGGNAIGGNGGDGEAVYTFCLSGGNGGNACPGGGGDSGMGGDGGNAGQGIDQQCIPISIPSGLAGNRGPGNTAGDVGGGQAGNGGQGITWAGGVHGEDGKFGGEINISGGGDGNNGNSSPGNTCGTVAGTAKGPGLNDGEVPDQIVIGPPCIQVTCIESEVEIDPFTDNEEEEVAGRNQAKVDNSLPSKAEDSVLALAIFPNPNRGDFMLRIDKEENDGIVQINIFDAQGSIIYRREMDSESQNTLWLNVQLENALASGIYLLQARFNNKVVNEKFVLIK